MSTTRQELLVFERECILGTENKRFIVEKSLLSKNSSLFKRLLDQQVNSHNTLVTIIINGVEFETLKSVIKFLNIGEVDVSYDEMITFLQTLNFLQIKGFYNDHEDENQVSGIMIQNEEQINTQQECTLVSDEGLLLNAQKSVLSEYSTYFEMVLDQHVTYDNYFIIIIKDVKFKILKSILQFLKEGEVDIPLGDMLYFIEAANSLQIGGFRRLSILYLPTSKM